MASNTKDKILLASRLLFNDEGVSNVAMVDIAATLDISPGNLYYHYRGKEQLIPVIFEQFYLDLSVLLTADTSSLTSLEDRWAYQFLILETLYNYRFIHGLDAIRFDKSLSKRYGRLRLLLVKVIDGLIDQLQIDTLESELFLAKEVSFNESNNNSMLAENIALFMFSWSSYAELNMSEENERIFLHDGVYRVFYQLLGAGNNSSKLLADCKSVMLSGVSDNP
jgi:AcrR family transcriptional regulator